MATAEQFTQGEQGEQGEQQMALIHGCDHGCDWQTDHWRLAYDALVGDVQALRAQVTEVRADLEALRADLATAD